MYSPHGTLETLDQVLVWLGRQQRTLAPAEWERLSELLHEAITSVLSLIERGEGRTAAAALDRIAASYGIWDEPRPGLSDPSSGLGHRDGGWDPDRPRDASGSRDNVRGSEPGDPRQGRGEITRGDTVRGDDHWLGREKLQQISRILSIGRAPAPIETHPEILVPAEVLERTMFQVSVSAHPKATPHTSGKLTLTRRQSGPVDLEVQLVLPAGQALTASSPTEAVLRVHEDGRAAAITFEVFAERPGAHPIEIAFRSGGIERARRQGRVLVRTREEHEQAASSEARALLGGAGVVPGGSFQGLLLQVDLRGVSEDHRSFRVVLGGTLWSGPPIEGHVELPADAPRLLAELCRDITSVSKLETAQARELRLRAIGRSLAQRALPDSIREALADPRWPDGTALHIESGDLHVPWEMLWLGDGAGPGFLGERFAVTRYPRLGTPREVVGGSAGYLIGPRSSGLELGTERTALRTLLGQAQELTSLHEVQQLLLGPAPCGVLHLACHGNCAPTGAFRDVLLMDGGPLSVVDVAVPERGQRGPLDGALIFINACRANIAEPGLWGHDGWAGAFLRSGAGAVIAPAWTVSDRGAGLFAEGLYRGAAAGHSLGEAARRARLHAAATGSADRHGYAVFASPAARLGGAGAIVQPEAGAMR